MRDEAPFGTVDLGEARSALAFVAPRLVTLIRTVDDPAAHAVGEWDIADVALHLVDAWEILPALVRQEIPPPLRDVWDLGGMTTTLVRGETDRDPLSAAGKIECAAAEFLAATANGAGDETVPWMVKGVEAPVSTFACHLLNESLVHGADIARAERRRWRIDPDHAALVMRGFVTPVIGKLDPRAMVIQERARDVDISYEIALRGGRGRLFLRIAGGALTVAEQPASPVDCHISADPSALLLVLFGRRSPWSALARGELLAWGRRPWLAPRMRALLRNP